VEQNAWDPECLSKKTFGVADAADGDGGRRKGEEEYNNGPKLLPASGSRFCPPHRWVLHGRTPCGNWPPSRNLPTTGFPVNPRTQSPITLKHSQRRGLEPLVPDLTVSEPRTTTNLLPCFTFPYLRRSLRGTAIDKVVSAHRSSSQNVSRICRPSVFSRR
jgi:hypothetical protein